MARHQLAPEVESELDEIWFRIASESGSLEIADRLIDSITSRFWILAKNPHIGRRRDQDLRPELRSFPVGDYVILYRIEKKTVLILHVIHGAQDLPKLLSS